MQAPTQSHSIVLTITGLGPVPSKKNRWGIGGLAKFGPGLWRGTPRVIQDKSVKVFVTKAVESFVSQLSSMCPTSADGITTECLQQFSTRSLPADDCWEQVEIGSVKTTLVAKGEEGATITIERI